MKFTDLSVTQQKVLLAIGRALNNRLQIAGYAAAPRLSAAHALVRRGLARTWETGVFHLSELGEEMYNAAKPPS